MKVDQTIFASDPKRQGNCVPACVATFLGIDLEQVPHFLEVGDAWRHCPDEPDTVVWWALMSGFMAGHGFWAVDLGSFAEAEAGEIVFVAGPSARGVLHQVLYRDGELFHDPHPSRDGLLEVREIEAWRPRHFDHNPTMHDWLGRPDSICACGWVPGGDGIGRPSLHQAWLAHVAEAS